MVPAGSIDNVKFGIQDNSTFLYPHCNETVELTGTVTSEGSPDLLNMKAYLVGVDSNGKGFRNLADLDEKGKYKFANVPKGSKFKVYLTNFDKSKYWASPSFAKGKPTRAVK